MTLRRPLARLQTRFATLVKTLSFIALLVLSTWLAPMAWGVAQPGKLYRIGYLQLAPLAETPSPQRAAFLNTMEKLGYVQGKNLIIKYSSAEANVEMLPEAAAELVSEKPELIISVGTPTALATKQATRTIPIVMFAADPVVNGIVASLAKPGGNITGVSGVQIKLNPKRLEILKEAVPHASRIAVLWSRVHPSHIQELAAIRSRAKELGLALQPFDVTRVEDLQAAFARMNASRPDAIFVLTDYRTLIYRQLIAEFAVRNRLPTMSGMREAVETGGLMSYGPNLVELFTRAAIFADRILNGADPQTLPVEQPTRFELVINRKTARSLGLRISEPLLLRANVLIE
jgi:putative tryptophan/tyrosine transport system substrate-binding protein